MMFKHFAGITNTSNYSRWTETAIMCYDRGCMCDGCYIQDILSDKCMMKYSVITLVRILGKPNCGKNGFFEGITEPEQRIVDAILNGFETKKEIAEYNNVTPNTIQMTLDELYKLAINNGAIFTKQKYKLPELVEFIKKIAKEKEND
ncbi:hypothetical protein IJS77_04705 [bacterium]|nr:hypothetical protein [bacterium]